MAELRAELQEGGSLRDYADALRGASRPQSGKRVKPYDPVADGRRTVKAWEKASVRQKYIDGFVAVLDRMEADAAEPNLPEDGNLVEDRRNLPVVYSGLPRPPYKLR